VILTSGNTGVAPLLQATRTVPIVFVEVIDPVGGGFVMSLARPGGNTTGFSLFEFSISGKWLELLKQITPRMTRAVEFITLLGSAAAGQSARTLCPNISAKASLRST
jgi:putative ABC transport system substrate-binding protein